MGFICTGLSIALAAPLCADYFGAYVGGSVWLAFAAAVATGWTIAACRPARPRQRPAKRRPASRLPWLNTPSWPVFRGAQAEEIETWQPVQLARPSSRREVLARERSIIVG